MQEDEEDDEIDIQIIVLMNGFGIAIWYHFHPSIDTIKRPIE